MKQQIHSSMVIAYTKEMAESRKSVQSKNYNKAVSHLRKAHSLSHNSKILHLQVHKNLIRVGWLKRSPNLIISNTGLLLAAWIFD